MRRPYQSFCLIRRKWLSGTIIVLKVFLLSARRPGYNCANYAPWGSRRLGAAVNRIAEEDVSVLLQAWSGGDQVALEKLIPIVYGELRRLARHYMRGERTENTLQTTALVNEAYLKLVDCKRMHFTDRAHFFAVSAQLMRRILVDHARKKNLKRGSGFQHLSLDQCDALQPKRGADLILLDDAMTALARFDPRKARVVELRFFGGLSVDETAEVLSVSTITIMRDWHAARAWLYREISSMPSESC
jgi:RNA polymerase sigma-70 factor (ECF subfamily)